MAVLETIKEQSFSFFLGATAMVISVSSSLKADAKIINKYKPIILELIALLCWRSHNQA